MARGLSWLHGVLHIFGNSAGGLRDLERHPSAPWGASSVQCWASTVLSIAAFGLLMDEGEVIS